MTNNPDPCFLRFSTPTWTSDGVRVGFRVETANGAPLDVTMHYGEIAALIQFLAVLARSAADQRGPAKSFQASEELAVPLIPATQLGVALSNAAGKANLVVRLSDFDLAFELPLEAFQGKFAEAVSVLTREPKDKH